MLAHTEIPTDPHERAAWVIYKLKAKRLSIAAVGRPRGWDRSMVRRALFQPSYPQEEALARALGLTVRQLFPERYDEEGNRLHFVRERNGGAPKAKEAAA